MVLDSFFSRRGVLATSLVGLVQAVAGKAYAASSSKKYLRPPGALSEDEFLSRCTKCQKCLQVCHMHIITPISVFEGVPAYGTPTITFKKGYCDLCMKCVDVCPYGAIKNIKKEEVAMGIAVIVKDSCIAWDWIGCVDCKDRCPLKAIELDSSKRPIIIKEKCNGCGECEFCCPTLALRSVNGRKNRKKGIIVVPWGEEQKYE